VNEAIAMILQGFAPPDALQTGLVPPADALQPAALRELTEAEVSSLVHDIEQSGYGVVAQYITGADLELLRHFARDAVATAGGSYTALNGYAPVASTVLGKMAVSPALKHICRRAYELAISRPAPDQTYYQVLRCLTGDAGRRNSMVFHFDSYVLTALLPIEVPAGKENGELILLPNLRPIRRWYVTNLIDKVLLDNKLTQWILRGLSKLRPERFVRIAMTPGDLYFFWGYRSIHTNAPCDADKIRATALFHYADPHQDSSLKNFLRRGRHGPFKRYSSGEGRRII
jgi:hypothetical protein